MGRFIFENIETEKIKPEDFFLYTQLITFEEGFWPFKKTKHLYVADIQNSEFMGRHISTLLDVYYKDKKMPYYKLKLNREIYEPLASFLTFAYNNPLLKNRYPFLIQVAISNNINFPYLVMYKEGEEFEFNSSEVEIIDKLSFLTNIVVEKFLLGYMDFLLNKKSNYIPFKYDEKTQTLIYFGNLNIDFSKAEMKEHLLMTNLFLIQINLLKKIAEKNYPYDKEKFEKVLEKYTQENEEEEKYLDGEKMLNTLFKKYEKEVGVKKNEYRKFR